MAGGWPSYATQLGVVVDVGTGSNFAGTSFSIGNGTKGSWATIVSSTPIDATGFALNVWTNSASSVLGLFDVAIGPAGSEIPIATNLRICTDGSRNYGYAFSVPVSIAAGQRLSVRGQYAINSFTPVATITLMQASINGASGFSSCVDVGTVISNSTGTIVTPGSSGTKGAYVQLTGSTPVDFGGFFVIFDGDNSGTSGAGMLEFIDISIGPSGSEVVIVPNLLVPRYATVSAPPSVSPMFTIPIPAGTRIASRGGAISSSPVGVTLHGLVA